MPITTTDSSLPLAGVDCGRTRSRRVPDDVVAVMVASRRGAPPLLTTAVAALLEGTPCTPTPSKEPTTRYSCCGGSGDGGGGEEVAEVVDGAPRGEWRDCTLDSGAVVVDDAAVAAEAAGSAGRTSRSTVPCCGAVAA